jgi:hypothetical protein
VEPVAFGKQKIDFIVAKTVGDAMVAKSTLVWGSALGRTYLYCALDVALVRS